MGSSTSSHPEAGSVFGPRAGAFTRGFQDFSVFRISCGAEVARHKKIHAWSSSNGSFWPQHRTSHDQNFVTHLRSVRRDESGHRERAVVHFVMKGGMKLVSELRVQGLLPACMAPPGLPRTSQDERRLPAPRFGGITMKTLRRHKCRLLREGQVLGLWFRASEATSRRDSWS